MNCSKCDYLMLLILITNLPTSSRHEGVLPYKTKVPPQGTPRIQTFKTAEKRRTSLNQVRLHYSSRRIWQHLHWQWHGSLRIWFRRNWERVVMLVVSQVGGGAPHVGLWVFPADRRCPQGLSHQLDEHLLQGQVSTLCLHVQSYNG